MIDSKVALYILEAAVDGMLTAGMVFLVMALVLHLLGVAPFPGTG